LVLVGALPEPDEHPAKKEKIIAAATGRPARTLAWASRQAAAIFAGIASSMALPGFHIHGGWSIRDICQRLSRRSG
jgi:hypothetical protein